jgi:hypothetical protein
VGVTRASVSLAGAAIDLHCAPGTEHLADAFLSGPSATGTAVAAPASGPPLHVTMRLDAAHLAARVPHDLDGSEHHRSGDAHVWVVPTPRHLERFTPGPAPHAELVVDATSIADGTVRARPAVHAIAAWAASRGVMPVHAGAVARDGRALLLIGRGGRGKTTTTLTLAARGWQLIADDLCFLETTPAGPVIHGLYATAVLTPAVVERLGADTWEGLGRTHAGKVASRLPATLPVAASAALTGVVTVTHGEGDPYRLTRLPRPAAHIAWQEAFAPALQTHGPTPAWLAAYAHATRTLPVSRLTLGWDVARLDEVLTGMLDGGDGGGVR